MDPRIAAPCKDTRDVSALRARTVRPERFAVVRVAAVVAVRDTTLRFATARDGAPVVTDVVVGRVVVRAATPRDCAADDVPRDTVVLADVLRGLARPERTTFPARVAIGDNVPEFTGAIGSANAERIDINVEHVKNAPPSKNIVPTAFLQQTKKLRRFICIPPRLKQSRFLRICVYKVLPLL